MMKTGDAEKVTRSGGRGGKGGQKEEEEGGGGSGGGGDAPLAALASSCSSPHLRNPIPDTPHMREESSALEYGMKKGGAADCWFGGCGWGCWARGAHANAARTHTRLFGASFLLCVCFVLLQLLSVSVSSGGRGGFV
jgi:hypothetical protein